VQTATSVVAAARPRTRRAPIGAPQATSNSDAKPWPPPTHMVTMP
jgi:hypothetical protein